MIGPLAYIGGKNRLASRIIELFPEHRTYVEPFCGGAQVFFHKPPSRVEVLNDLDGEVVNFLRVCQWHHAELVRHLDYLVVSRKLHDLFLSTNPATLTDVQRATRFFYLQKNSFGGLVVKQKFHYGVVQPTNYTPRRIPSLIEETHERLQGVQLESLPYEQIIEHFDRAETLFYLDPPYYQRYLYKHNLKEEDFAEMARRLSQIRGRFVLSLNDHPDVRRIFGQFQLTEASLSYTAQRKVGKRYAELLITNFVPKKRDLSGSPRSRGTAALTT